MPPKKKNMPPKKGIISQKMKATKKQEYREYEGTQVFAEWVANNVMTDAEEKAFFLRKFQSKTVDFDFRTAWKTLNVPRQARPGWNLRNTTADAMQRMIYLDIAEYETVSFAAFQFKFGQISEATDFLPHVGGTASEIKLWNFDGTIYPVKIVYGLRGWQPLLRTGGDWKFVKEVMEAHIKAQASYLHERPYQPELLEKWWKMNGKSFNLLGLPQELRDTIYDMAFSKEILPFKYRRQDVRKPRGPSILSTWEPPFALFQVPEIGFEARLACMRVGRFVFREPVLFEKFFRIVPKPVLRHIKSVGLVDWLAADLLRLFGARLSNRHDFRVSPAIALIKTLPCVTLRVELSEAGLWNGEPEWLVDRERPCMKKVVGWLLTAMEPVARCINVQLEKGPMNEQDKIQKFMEDHKKWRNGGEKLPIDTIPRAIASKPVPDTHTVEIKPSLFGGKSMEEEPKVTSHAGSAIKSPMSVPTTNSSIRTMPRSQLVRINKRLDEINSKISSLPAKTNNKPKSPRFKPDRTKKQLLDERDKLMAMLPRESSIDLPSPRSPAWKKKPDTGLAGKLVREKKVVPMHSPPPQTAPKNPYEGVVLPAICICKEQCWTLD